MHVRGILRCAAEEPRGEIVRLLIDREREVRGVLELPAGGGKYERVINRVGGCMREAGARREAGDGAERHENEQQHGEPLRNAARFHAEDS